MPTRSIIAQQVDGQQRFRAVYCHYDGYPAGVGAILDAHYGDAEKLTKERASRKPRRLGRG